MSARVLLLGDRGRAGVGGMLDAVGGIVDGRGVVVEERCADNEPLPTSLDCTVAVAVGGDGTLIGQARRLLGHDLPLVGVNVGRLGFLAAFDLESLREHADVVFGATPPERMPFVLGAAVDGDGRVRPAINDCVITAGDPFHMIELRLRIDGEEGPVLSGDGVIVATPLGSTAYNVSAGGPIVHPDLDAMVITPLAAHSLAFRPIVVGGDAELEIEILEANPGTSLIQDGQVRTQVARGDRITIRRHARRARLVTNPASSYWRTIQDKLRWAAPPKYGG